MMSVPSSNFMVENDLLSWARDDNPLASYSRSSAFHTLNAVSHSAMKGTISSSTLVRIWIRALLSFLFHSFACAAVTAGTLGFVTCPASSFSSLISGASTSGTLSSRVSSHSYKRSTSIMRTFHDL